MIKWIKIISFAIFSALMTGKENEFFPSFHIFNK